MPLLVLDANVLFDSPMLTSPEWESIIENRMAWELQIVIPAVVVMETGVIVKREWAKARATVNGLRVGALGLKPESEQLAAAIQSKIDGYENALANRIETAGIAVAGVPDVDQLEIARRASQGRAPYSAKDKDGYRDTLIWLTLLDVAAESPEEDVWFVSNNTQDFGPPPGQWTLSPGGSRDSCPILFHSQLTAELDGLGLKNRIHYVASLKSLEQHLAAQHAPIRAEELAPLLAAIDYDQLGAYLRNQAVERFVDPEMIALDPSSRGAAILDVRSDNSTWEFSEAANRGEGSWTAKFDVAASIDLEVVLPTGIAATQSKKLIVSGDVVLSKPAALVSLDISGIEAPSDDLNRLLWEGPSVRLGRFINAWGHNPRVLDESEWDRWLGRLSNPIPNSFSNPMSSSADFLSAAGSITNANRLRDALTNPVAEAAERVNRVHDALANPVGKAMASTNRLRDALSNPVGEAVEKTNRIQKLSEGLTDQQGKQGK